MLQLIPAHIMVPENETWVLRYGIDVHDQRFSNRLGKRVNGAWALESQAASRWNGGKSGDFHYNWYDHLRRHLSGRAGSLATSTTVDALLRFHLPKRWQVRFVLAGSADDDWKRRSII